MAPPDLKSQVAEHARANYPFACCDRCLAARFRVSAAEIAEATRALTAEPGWHRRRRVCYGCGRTSELLCPA